MRPKTQIGILLSLVLVVGLALWWQWATWRQRSDFARKENVPAPIALRLTNASVSARAAGAALSPAPSSPFALIATNLPNAPFTNTLAYRLTNSAQTFPELLRNDRAVLLRNAIFDTALGAPNIPDHLRAQGDPNAYIVQARGAITDQFRAEIQRLGAAIVSYVPNNAYLVQASAEVAKNIGASPITQSVLPFEPYYKLDARLLALAVNQELSPHALINVVAFPGTTPNARAALKQIGAEVVREPQTTAFGDILTVKADADKLPAIAQISSVQMMGVHYEKRPVNDLTRVLTRISTNRQAANPPLPPPLSHYPAPVPGGRLTGDKVLVAIADTGVDISHPDLLNRVVLGGVIALSDFDGHGTHVVGTLLGDGSASPLATNAIGSFTNAVFSGMAPRAKGYVQDLYEDDSTLQRNTALTNALISNNSWGFAGDNDYDIFAASYDAAVRDSLPGVTGEQQVTYVFAAGNEGGGGDSGLNGRPGSVISPATGKNVITVGGSDLPRYITNVVTRAGQATRPWFGMTDTNNEVSPYSSRGNVGIGSEGVFGRFKPDVIAPGSMLVSTRSKDYIEPTNSASTFIFQYNGQTIPFNQTNLYALGIPANAVSVTIRTLTNFLSPTNMTLAIGADIDTLPGPGSLFGINEVTLDLTTAPALQAGVLYYTVANTNHDPSATFDLAVFLTVTNDVGDYYDVLKKMNEPLKIGEQGYRYEAGTSMAAPAVSGFLALVQEFLRESLAVTNPSPALMKALLINGARSLSPNYNLQVTAPINHQGWGLVNMSNTVPSGIGQGSNGPMRFVDQSLTNSLPTGVAQRYTITVPNQARSFPLRITLVWTDPPGNPVTGVKLVNDLNLSVFGDSTNTIDGTSSSFLWLGNNFPSGSDFSDSILTASTDPFEEPITNLTEVIEVTRDLVNNVENVFIRPPLARSYDIVVKGHRVNVGAVSTHPNSLAQDYALVISSGNVATNNNVNLAVSAPVFTNDPSPRIAALVRATNATTAGLLNQRVGANNPLIVSTNGATNQWAFFTYTNVPTANFTNVAILTFFAPELSLPRFREADIDLYVARNNGADLFAMDETLRSAAIAGSTRSTTRLGTELVVFNNAQPNEVFYIGVKSEDQQGANFNIFAASSDRPFSGRDASNNIVARALPLPAVLGDGEPAAPFGTNLLMIVFDPDVVVQRVYLTNAMFHEQGGDLIGILSHADPSDGTAAAVTLNNHRSWVGYTNVIYDESDETDLDGSLIPVMAPDGPGSLRDFIGQQAFGVWNFSISDNALFHTGSVEELTMVIVPASTNDDQAVNIVANIREGGWLYAGFPVPADATNVETCVIEITPALPAEAYIRRGFLPTRTQYDKSGTNVPPANGFCFNYGLEDAPPLSPGRHFVGVFNPGPGTVRVRLVVTIQRGLRPDRTTIAANNNLTSLIDDATTNSFLFVTNQGIVTSVEVDVRLHHPRIADVSLHLINPIGTRLLLAENRGRDTTNGYGVSISNVLITNFGARIFDDGFESVDQSTAFYASGNYPVGQIISGWRVDSGNIDVIHPPPPSPLGLFVPSHTGTNGVDLNGTLNGSISTNIATTIGKTYLLSFVYCQNPGANGATVVAAVDFAGSSATLTHSTFVPSGMPVWLGTSIVVQATSAVTQLRFRSVSTPDGSAGMFIDTVRIDEAEITTNSLLYATFTDNALKALLPIKFAPPPFGDTNYVSTNVFISGFEGTNGGFFTNALIYTNRNVFTNGQTYDGWRVTTNTVYVQTNNVLAYSDTNYLLLRTGRVSRVLSNTVQGKEYVLQFATRVAPRRLIYSTGVDEDALALIYGSVDSHYFVSSNSVTFATNRAFVLNNTTPPMGAPWRDRTLSDARWIGVNPTSPPPGNAFYAFKTKFNLTAYDWRLASLTGRFRADGEPAIVRINGTNAATIPLNSYQSVTAPLLTFTNLFLPGMNTLEVILPNAPTPVTNTALGLQARFAADAIKAPLLFSNIAPPLNSAVGEVRLAGAYTNYFTALSDGWRVQNITFVAPSNNVLLEFTGITPGVWLDHVQIRETGRKYYQPEEPLTPFVGQPSRGIWNLEVWDNRLGAVVSDSSLISWRLNLNFVRTNPPFLRLVNGVETPTLTIGTNAVRYFVFDVPCDFGTVSNWLESLTLPNALDLFFNQNTFPLTGANGDFPLLLNTTNGTSNLEVGVAPLFRSGRYYLAVRSTNAVPVDFVMGAEMLGFPPCPPPPASIVSISKSSFGPEGFVLEWQASPADEFIIEYANDPAGPWAEVPGTASSGDGAFSFTDNGTLTGGLPPQRFYRLRRQ